MFSGDRIVISISCHTHTHTYTMDSITAFAVFACGLNYFIISVNSVSTGWDINRDFDAKTPNLTDKQMDLCDRLQVFYDFDSVLRIFHSPQFRYRSDTKRAMNAFEYGCIDDRPLPQLNCRRKPFIVIEGNQRISRKSVGKKLARIMQASFLENPPKCLFHLRNYFGPGSPLRRPFFALSMYASGLIAQRVIIRYPVIMNGYWLDQAAFSISRAYSNSTLPSDKSGIFDWPRDLPKPDIIFYINTPDDDDPHVMTVRPPFSNWKNRMMELYKKVKSPPVSIIDTSKGLFKAVKEIQHVLWSKLGGMFDIKFDENLDSAFNREDFYSYPYNYNKRAPKEG